jgi:hypothetical protein
MIFIKHGKLQYFILHTSYFIPQTSYLIPHTSYFILHTSYFILLIIYRFPVICKSCNAVNPSLHAIQNFRVFFPKTKKRIPKKILFVENNSIPLYFNFFVEKKYTLQLQQHKTKFQDLHAQKHANSEYSEIL